MESRSGASSTVPPLSTETKLQLLVELRPWAEVFRENLWDTLLFRRPPQVPITSRPAKFWSDVFVGSGIPWARMRQSMLLHAFVAVSIWGATNVWQRILLQRNPALQIHDKIYYYAAADFLPPIHNDEPAPKPRRGAPLAAKQKIISLRPNADNHEQTIISKVDVKLPVNLAIPNIVNWTDRPAVPDAVASRDKQVVFPVEMPQVIQPAPEPVARDIAQMHIAQDATQIIQPPPAFDAVNSNRRIESATNVIEPPPSPDPDKLEARILKAPTPAVIEPTNANVSRDIGAMNIGKAVPTVAAPVLPIAQQRAAFELRQATGSLRGGRGTNGAAEPSAPTVPPQGPNGNAMEATGQLIALSLHPATPIGPPNVPPGNRNGEFATGPEGKPDAPGTPDIRPNAAENGFGSGGKGKSNAPAGIIIGAPPPGAVPQAATQQLAAVHPPRVGETIPARTSSPDFSTEPRIERRIFGDRKSYTLSLNMPNLASSGGSWIIRFAELDQPPNHSQGDLSAPIAMTKVDPAYPADLMRDGVEGTVILYAVIRKDGTIADVRVLRGVQTKLDQSASMALSRWKFRPGTRNGEAVDLEAVVQIPFRAPRERF